MSAVATSLTVGEEVAMAAGEPTKDRDGTEGERVRTRLDDPAVKERLRQIHDEIEAGTLGPGIRSEELRDFLREQRR
jgi:hypothetical protein